jgi:hypothetical protein
MENDQIKLSDFIWHVMYFKQELLKYYLRITPTIKSGHSNSHGIPEI